MAVQVVSKMKSRMRVIAGSAGGRFLKQVPGGETRPTKDRVKEAIFSSIGERVTGASVLDLFGGSGALGIEALSRGAKEAVFVETSSRACDVITENLQMCALLDRGVIRNQSATSFLNSSEQQFDLILIDPPYEWGLPSGLLGSLLDRKLVASDALIVVEVRSSTDIDAIPDGLLLRSRKEYGDTAVIYLEEAH